MAWHYRDCDLGHGAWQAKQLHVSLLQLSKRLPISVYAGDKVRGDLPILSFVHRHRILVSKKKRVHTIYCQARQVTVLLIFLWFLSVFLSFFLSFPPKKCLF